LLRRAALDFADAEDREREERLRLALGLAVLRIDAHHGIDPADARHLFVQTSEGPVFACVAVPESWVEAVLALLSQRDCQVRHRRA
jgi:hypothetical protein